MRRSHMFHYAGLHGMYPLKREKDLHRELRENVEWAHRRWPEFALLERAYGIDQLPDEARSWAYDYLMAHRMNFRAREWGRKGWRGEIHSPADLKEPKAILRHYLPPGRLKKILRVMRQLAEDEVRNAPPPDFLSFKAWRG